MQALVGIDFSIAVLITGAMMLCYVIFGGMLATTWVQIIKAVLLMIGDRRDVAVRARARRLQPDRAVQPRGGATRPRSRTFSLGPGTFLSSPIDTVSLGIALVLGTAGLPHILMRFFTVPDAKAARTSVVWAIVHHRRLLRPDDVRRLRRARAARPGRRRGGGHGRQPRRAEPRAVPRRRRGHVRRRPLPRDRRGGRVRDDPRGRRRARALGVRRGRARPVVQRHPQGPASPSTRRCSSRGSPPPRIGAIAIVIAIVGGEGLNVSFMVGLAFAVAASANFPALLLALTWRRFNTAGAVDGRRVRRAQRDHPRDHLAEGLAGPGRRGRRAVVLRPRQPRASSRSRSASSAAGWARCCRPSAATSASSTSCYVRSETGLGAEQAGVVAPEKEHALL